MAKADLQATVDKALLKGHILRQNLVTEHLRQAINGLHEISLIGPTWHEVFAGEVTVKIGGWTMAFFNDCDSLDYLDSAIDAHGAACDFDWWYDNGGDPLDYLNATERDRLYRILSELQPNPEDNRR